MTGLSFTPAESFAEIVRKAREARTEWVTASSAYRAAPTAGNAAVLEDAENDLEYYEEAEDQAAAANVREYGLDKYPFLTDLNAELQLYPLFGGRAPLNLLVTATGSGRGVILSTREADGAVLLNGFAADLGDDLPVLLGILDAGAAGTIRLRAGE